MTDLYYYDPSIGLAFFAFIILITILVLAFFFTPSRTRRYRQELADLYVAAKIKEIAAKEKLDLAAEFEDFKKWKKNKMMEELSLDRAIEEDLKEKIGEPEEPKVSKK